VKLKNYSSLVPVALFSASPAHASLFSGETLDTVANVLSWIVLFIAPVVVIGVFLMVHILPEKVAEERRHPQLSAIKTLCLLSLVFGGMLWPIAWLWAYSKPVLYKLAYGTDVADHVPGEPASAKENEPGGTKSPQAR
jgi:tellurite resistance protein TehA-like permease